jgi:hypothetical protein
MVEQELLSDLKWVLEVLSYMQGCIKIPWEGPDKEHFKELCKKYGQKDDPYGESYEKTK